MGRFPFPLFAGERTVRADGEETRDPGRLRAAQSSAGEQAALEDPDDAVFFSFLFDLRTRV